MSDPAAAAQRPGAGVQVTELWRTFHKGGQQIDVLRGANLAVGAGEAVALVGQSGSGKSTFLHILAALEPPTRGEISISGRARSGASRAELDRFRNEDVGLVFQFHHLLPDQTALDNVAMPALIGRATLPVARERARALLVRVGLEKRLQHRPGELSGGEQQRVAMARALMMEPVLILADEPTGNLDPATASEVMGLLREVQTERGVTLIVVTHAMDLAAKCDRVVRLVEGRMVEA